MTVNAQQTFTNFQAASIVVGQANFTAQSTIIDQFTGGGSSSSAVSVQGVLAVGSQSRNRVLLYNTIPTTNGVAANVVIGQPNFNTNTPAFTQSGCNSIDGVCFSPDGNKLIVSDAINNRVLIWNTIPTVNGQNADVVIGQTNFITNTNGIAANKFSYPAGVLVTPDGKLIVNDANNNRVLIFNSIPTANNASADVVIGQSTFTTNTPGNGANQLNYTWYSALSPDGKLLISEVNNHRVLIFNTVPTTNGASANNVIGQTGFGLSAPGLTQNKFNIPVGVTCSPDGKLAVGDFSNNRVLIFNTIPTANGANADVVLGQPGFVTNTPFNGGVTAQSFSSLYGINFDLYGRLFANGRDMNRLMIFGAIPTQTADVSVSMASASASLCQGSSVGFTVTVTNNGPSTASNVIASAALPALFNLTSYTASAGTYTSASGLWNIPSIANGSFVTLVFTGNVNTSIPQVISAYGNLVNSQQFDNVLTNNATTTTLSVSSATAPSGGSVSSPTLICSGGTYSLTVNGVTNATNYNWSASNATVTGTGTLVSVTFGSSNSNVIITPSNASCTGPNVTQTVAVNALPSVSVTSSNPLICLGSTATLTASGANSYTWNTTSNATVIAVSPTVTTQYTVSGTGANACLNTITITQTVALCTGINSNSVESLLATVYPNPNNGFIKVESINTMEKIEVIDLNGRIVLVEANINNSNYSMNLSSLNNSVYLLRVKLVSGETSNTRIVVQK